MNTIRTCGNCKDWKPIVNSENGRCIAHPPVLKMFITGNSNTWDDVTSLKIETYHTWECPLMQYQEVCGEFKEKLK